MFDFDLFGSREDAEEYYKTIQKASGIQEDEYSIKGERCTSCNGKATKECPKCRKKCICNNPTCSLNHNRKFHNAKTIHERSYA